MLAKKVFKFKLILVHSGQFQGHLHQVLHYRVAREGVVNCQSDTYEPPTPMNLSSSHGECVR